MARPELMAFAYDEADDGVEIIFARSEAGARALACGQTGNHFEEQEVTHVPCFDQYATKTGGRVTDAQRFAEGWPVFCWHCEHTIRNEVCETCCERDGIDDGLYSEPPVEEDTVVYCNRRCRDGHREYQSRIKQKKAEACATLLAWLPFVDIKGSWIGSPGQCRCSGRDHENISVRFKLPGGALSEKTADGDAYHNIYCHGCRQAWIAQGDSDVFQGLNVRPDVVVERAGP